MLSYRHAFHAGNHADVLKHFVLVALLRHLLLKDKPFWMIDTHAGAGGYRLDAGHAAKNAEWQSGIARLLACDDLPPALADYAGLVRDMNPAGRLMFYPGSPGLAWSLLRAHDAMRLFERHSTDASLLEKTFREAGRQVIVTRGDGLAGLKSVLPPAPRRGLVLIDPSYEDKHDHSSVVASLADSLKRFATGLYVVWYPLLPRSEALRFSTRLRDLGAHWLDARLTVSHPGDEGFGMYGSGVFVINPPWTLEGTLRECLPVLRDVLGQDEGAGYGVDVA